MGPEPKSAGRQFNFSVKFVPTDADSLKADIVRANEVNDCVGILADCSSSSLFWPDLASVYLYFFDGASANKNLQNYFGHILSRWLRNLIFLHSCFGDGKKKKCLILPFSIFECCTLSGLSAFILEHNTNRSFPEILDLKLKTIRARSKPKKRKRDKQQFLVDDSKKFFELAKEKHGQAETLCPPHSSSCRLGAISRFGVTMSRDEHFNVSYETGLIYGSFQSCHGRQDLTPCTHLNVFPNGFIR